MVGRLHVDAIIMDAKPVRKGVEIDAPSEVERQARVPIADQGQEPSEAHDDPVSWKTGDRVGERGDGRIEAGLRGRVKWIGVHPREVPDERAEVRAPVCRLGRGHRLE